MLGFLKKCFEDLLGNFTGPPRDSGQVFSCEFCEISENIFFTEHLLGTAFFENVIAGIYLNYE